MIAQTQKTLFGQNIKENTPFWLRNMLVLGQGAPNKSKSLRSIATCVALWSRESGFCRIYPVPHNKIKDWQYIDVEVIKSNSDKRKNSYKVNKCEQDWPKVNINILNKKISRENKIKLIEELATGTIKKAEANKDSFTIIRPKTMKFIVENRILKKRKQNDNQTKIIDFSEIGEKDPIKLNSQKDYPFTIKLKYSCQEDCNCINRQHNQSIVEYGAYEWMRKNSVNKEHYLKLEENYHLNDPKYKHWLLVGNQKLHPHRYIVVKILRFKI